MTGPTYNVTITDAQGNTGSAPIATTAPPPPPPPQPPPIIGCTCNPRAFGLPGNGDGIVQTAQKIDALVGRPFATLGNKAYEQATPTYTKLPDKYTALGPKAHYLISVKPGWTSNDGMPVSSSAEAAKLEAFGQLLLNGHVNFDFTLWQEANLAESPFKTAQSYIDWYRFYAPVISGLGIRCVYDPGASSPDTAFSYYPGDDVVSVVCCDYYNGAWHRKITLEQLSALAYNRKDGKKVPFGPAEWGSSIADPTKTPIANVTDYTHYCSDMANFFTSAKAAGNPIYGAICFVAWPGSPGHSTTNDLTTADNFKVPGTQLLIDTLAKL